MSGQYLGLFFAALLFLWLGSKRVDTDKKPLFCYSIVMAVVVLCPVTAWVLLKYQTAFYTYSHLFLLIPMVLVLAWGMTEGTERALEYLPGQPERAGFARKYRKLCEGVALFLCAMLLMLAGTVAPAAEPTARTENDSKMPSEVLEVLCTLETMENVNLQEEVLLAPDEVLEYARAYNGEFRLLYGRNMWIPELNAYTYDTYLPELQEIHTWLNPFNDPFRTMIPKVVEENMTPAQGIRSIAESGCTLLVLEGAQYENAEVRNALDQADNFVYLTETDEYVILQKRK